MLLAATVLAAIAGLAVAPSAQAQEEPPPSTEPPSADGESTDTTGRQARLTGTLRFDREPVEGAEIEVREGGDVIDTTTSDETGRWEIPVPPGTYDVEILTDSLPEGVTLRDEDKAVQEGLEVSPGQRKGVIFALGEPQGGANRGLVDRFADLTISGLRIGLIISITAIGLSLIFGVTGLVNFAHGELVAFGALVAWWFNAASGGPTIHVIPAALIAIAAGGALGFTLERGLFQRLRRRRLDNISLIVVTIGLALFLRHIYLAALGPESRPFIDYRAQKQVSAGPFDFTPREIVVMALCLAVLGAVGLFLRKARFGKAMRAVADNPDLAESSGIDVERVVLLVWVAGTALASLGGVLQGITITVSWDMGFNLLLLMFAAVILGGIGTAFGAAAGGVLIGLVTQWSSYWVSQELKVSMALLVLIAVLLVRPQGIFGRAGRIG